MKKEDKKNQDENENIDKIKPKLSERVALSFRKKWLLSTSITVLLILVMIAAYISFNLWVIDLDLSKIDLTEDKVYTLSEQSKNVIKNIDKDVKIYTYGYEDNSNFAKFIRQYTKVNSRIVQIPLNNDTNPQLMQELGENFNSTLVIVMSGEKRTIITPSSDFTTYSSLTGDEIDVTEEKITNTILSLCDENLPNIYFVQGHGELTPDESGGIYYLASYMKNESYTVNTINLLTEDIPEDCDILAIISPGQDFMEQEVTKVKEFINKGKNLFVTIDRISLTEDNSSFPNVQAILDEYGVSVDTSGYVLELKKGSYYTNSTTQKSTPLAFIPEINTSHEITSDLSQESTPIWLIYNGRLKYKSDEELSSMNVTKTVLANSSNESSFSTALNNVTIEQMIASASSGQSDIIALMTKTLPASSENSDENNTNVSNLVICSSSAFLSDVSGLFGSDNNSVESQYPMISLGNNKNLAINAFAFLGNKDYNISVRKNTGSSVNAYTPTNEQSRNVFLIVFATPFIIILIGFAVSAFRNRRR